jgi:regulator of protease activity HflC (stomatin/prohibitin superfamily)
MLVLGIAGLVAGVVLGVVASHQRGGAAVVLVVVCVLVIATSIVALAGLTPVVPGRARVVQLFGRYRGTIRDSGLQWVNPFTRRIAVSTRIRNQESAQAKVNDADGNPIEIAAVVVWQVADTARASHPPAKTGIPMGNDARAPRFLRPVVRAGAPAGPAGP